MLDQLREHGSEILSRADAGPVARTRCGQSSFTIVSPGKTACKSRFWPFSIQIVLASTMHYHADLEWVRTAFRNFSRTVVPITKPVQAAGGHKIGHSLMGRTPPLHAWPKSSVLVGNAMRELGRCRGWITLGRNGSFTFVWRCDFSLLQLRPKYEYVPCLISAPRSVPNCEADAWQAHLKPGVAGHRGDIDRTSVLSYDP